jgi:hypothetical protein
MEKDFIDLVGHVFTLQWATWALPVSLLLSLCIKRVVPGLLISILAVLIHHAGPVALPALLGGEGIAVIVKDLSALVPKLEPVSIVAEYVAYAYLIIVFSLTRRDMFRPGVSH